MRRLYSVFDLKAKAYGPVMAYAHPAQAVRDFSQAVQDPQSTLCKYPEDFELQDLGGMDDGAPVPVEGTVPVVVITASAVKAMQATGPQLAREA